MGVIYKITSPDIKEQERVRTSNLHGYAERLVDTDPKND